MAYTPVARIVGAHGLKGFLKLALLTDFPERLAEGTRLRLDNAWVTVRATAVHQDRLMVQLDGFRDRSSAEALRGKTLEAEISTPKLAGDEFMVSDLVGCEVVTTEGQELGPVDDVLPYPAQDVLVVGPTLIPFVRAFVKAVDLPARRLTVELIPGMIADPEAFE
ncbi:MAG: ribosome maturation factor RimM [Fimbriimonadaceae bacterium]